ncbi:hypothetical protein CPJCM30710_20980 [Clostridium polyendosporum]|uniref:Uncharacterized protein n=1 Tax=Clostridium polyendosporum TaxID=69208 RepID=A0A919VGQ7_9CLOT|nr:hypothetical protein [Clostridium polyendosporum]GIM29432.1 hypothetical protein CPJCM30710_20980 [Clostridium polyendosporum]
MDQFKEQFVTTEDLGLYKLANGGMIVCLIFTLLCMTLGGVIPGLIFLVSSGIIFYAKRFLYVEYEYSITNGEVDIDSLFEAKSRKPKITFNMKEVSLFTPLESNEYKDFTNKPEKIINAVPKGNNSKVYAALVTEGNQRAQVLFVPNDEFIDTCRLFNPKAVKKN